MKIKTLIADDNKLFRELLCHRFLETTDIEVVAEADNHRELIDMVGKAEPSIALIDIGQPQLKGIESTQKIKQDYPTCKVIALTSKTEKTYIKGTLDAGAYGYLLKNTTFDELSTTIREIHNGERRVSGDIQSIILEDYLGRKASNGYYLTQRESEVLKLLAEGKSIKEIADTFFISIKTVGTHKQNIFDKMGFENLAQLVRYALKNGIVY